MASKNRTVRLEVERLENRITPGVIVIVPAPSPNSLVSLSGTGLGSQNTVRYGLENPNNSHTPFKQNYFSQGIVFGQAGYIDEVFRVNNSNGISEFRMEANIFNATGGAWSELSFQLGFGTGALFAPMVNDYSGTGLDLDWRPTGDLTAYRQIVSGMIYAPVGALIYPGGTYQPSEIDIIGFQPNASGTTFWFNIDVPDSNANGIPLALRQGNPQGYNFTLRITPNINVVSGPPLNALNTSASTDGTATTIDVLQNDYDTDGYTMTVTAVGTPAYGTAVINGDNTVTYTPTSGTTAATDLFTYTISDGHGDTATATAYVNLTKQAPVAADVTASAHSTAVTIPVLANDSDPDGATLTVTAVGTPAHGTAVINGGNTVTYTPTSGTTFATDGFTYTISDGAGDLATASVVVYLVDEPPVADEVFASAQSAAVTIPVLANDSSPDGNTLTVTAVGAPAHGTAVINGGNTVTYTPTSGTTYATDGFTYTISDGYGGTATASVVVYLADRPPVAYDAAAIAHSAAVTINVLSNDSSPDGDTLTVTAVGTPAHGTAVINVDNTVTYTPTGGTTVATDDFTYTISDGHGGTATATVYLYLTDRPPIANPGVASAHSAAVIIPVLADDFSPDGDTLTVTAVGTPSHGTAVLNGANTVTYTPTSGTTVATDDFTYTVSDGYGGTATGTVVVYLADRPPVAGDVSASADGAAVVIGLLPDDYSSEGATLTVTAVGTPSHGTAVLNADNTVTYTPTSGTTAATDDFTYTISDGYGGTATATVSVQLADVAPVVVNVTAIPNSAAVIVPVLAGDYSPEGDTLTVTAVGTPSHGTAVINADNTVTYTPTSGGTATTDSFTYTVGDGHGGSATATVSVLLTDQAPVAVGITANPHGNPVTIGVLAGDSDAAAADTLTVTAVGTPSHGTAVLNADNTVTYKPTSGTTASIDNFTYTVSDGHGGNSTATVTINLTDQAPTAVNVSASPHGNPVIIAVLAGDSSPEGDTLTVSAVSTPSHGSAVINADNTVTYTPAGGTTAATDSFTYTISDGNGDNATATVSIFLTDRAPVALGQAVPLHGSANVIIPVLNGDSDPDGDTLTVTAIGSASHGTAVLNADNTVTYTPTSGTTAAIDNFTYTISDGYGGTATATVTVFLSDPGPIANPVSINTSNGATTINLIANDFNPDGDPVTVTAIGTPVHGTATLNSNGTVTYNPGAYSGTDTFTYTISDGHGGTATATVTVTAMYPNLYSVQADNVYTTTYKNAPETFDVLANAFNATSYALTVIAVGSATNGSVTLNANGTVTYTPTPGTTATTDYISYEISDGHGDTSWATICVTLDH